MDITKSNFKENIANIKSAITNASFLAIDCEFSGLNIDSETNINPYDSYLQYYSKIRRNVNKFLILQFGLCAFRFDENDKKFKQKCFNFYLFPQPTHKSIPDKRFLCQTSSICFLASHNFDFNKVFKEGITYLNSKDEEKFRDILEERLKNTTEASSTSNNANNVIPVPDDDKPFVDDIMKIIKNFRDGPNNELMLPSCNSFRRRLIYQTAREKFGTSVNLETRIMENKDRVLFVTKPETPEQIMEKEKQKYELNLAELENAVGFSRIIQWISQSEKLIIGHNLCLDLLHIIDTFLTPLPECYDEFKNCASCLFSNILDTKFLASTSAFKDVVDNTVLSNLINTFISKDIFKIPDIEIDEDSQGYTLEDDKKHEAGYDAFLTGICFLTMAKYLDDSDNYYTLRSKKLCTFLNKIFVLKLQDCGYINLNGPDPKPSRDHVLYITFPKEWKTNDITQLFNPFGNVHIAWINDTSAYISLYKKDQALIALSSLKQSDKYKVMSYARYQTLLNSHVPIASVTQQITKKKRELDVTSTFRTKKQRRDKNFGESSVNTIVEEPEDETESIATRMTRMFDENVAWD